MARCNIEGCQSTEITVLTDKTTTKYICKGCGNEITVENGWINRKRRMYRKKKKYTSPRSFRPSHTHR